MKWTIYTFWEPKGRLTSYLRLCIETWKPFIRDVDHVLLDHSNLFSYLPEDALDLDKIKPLSYMHQKDIIQAAVLKFNGGIFMDADMILTQDITRLIAQYAQYEVVTFNSHVAFMMAKPGARLLEEWYAEVIKRVERLSGNPNVKWDHFANSIIDAKLKDQKYNSYRINKLKTAFTPEHNYYKNLIDPQDLYLKFWFSKEITIESAFYENQYVIALHNSWTPDWYRQLSREEVLSHPSLLSRILTTDLTFDKLKKQPKISSNRIFRMRLCRKIHNAVVKVLHSFAL